MVEGNPGLEEVKVKVDLASILDVDSEQMGLLVPHAGLRRLFIVPDKKLSGWVEKKREKTFNLPLARYLHRVYPKLGDLTSAFGEGGSGDQNKLNVGVEFWRPVEKAMRALQEN